jgi:hypothetical protein
MNIREISPARAKQPAPPLQGGFLAPRKFPGLAPWAFLLDPFRVQLDSLSKCHSGQAP